MTAPEAGLWSFWIDRGGTFTDVIGLDGKGAPHTLKLPSVSADYEDAAVEAMRRLLDAKPGEPFPAARVAAIRVGATVATNALLERTGAKTVFVTTAGFADVLAIGDQTRPELFALDIVKPAPLHAGVIEARERLAADGAVITALDEGALAQALAAARAEGFEAAAIAFLHSDLNGAHESRAAAIAREAGFAYVVESREASPLPKFLPRAETAVLDAYLTPPLRAYAAGLAKAVAGADLFFMTSGGGLCLASAFRGRDAVLSGPAGGVVGVARTARAAGAPAVLGFDMGGTSTDVCRFAGALERRDSARVAGVRFRAAMLDVETVAAGGGSILTFDGLRARVGPRSAGADPGPACYGRGGPATVTDANLVLGRLDPRFFPKVFGLDGRQALDPVAAAAALTELASAMNKSDAHEAASGFIAVAVEQTTSAIRHVSTVRGFDPRDHALVAFGGAAGQIACAVAEALEMREVLCPRYASLLSAWGIGQARMRASRQAGLEQHLDEDGLAAARALADTLAGHARADLDLQGVNVSQTTVSLGLRYEDSDATITAAPGGLAEIVSAFEAAHARLFGFIEAGRPILIARVEVEAQEPDDESPPPVAAASHGWRLSAVSLPPASGGSVPKGRRGVSRRSRSLLTHSPAPASRVLPPDAGGRDFPPGRMGEPDGCAGGDIVFAEEIAGPLAGPRLIVRGDTQIWLEAGWSAAPGEDGLLRLTRHSAAASAASSASVVDPVTLELFNRRFMGVAEAMGAALERTARSVNIKERLDFSCALFDAAGGLVANAPHMPVHLGSMGASVRAVKARHPDPRPGEAFALNNPYAGGTHLPDITVVMPVFLAGESTPAFYTAARGHHADVGGVQPGSMPPFSRSIGEEGVMLDAVPIMRAGRFQEEETRAALLAGSWPCRSPDRNIGDLKAQIAACQAGAATVAAMIEAHGRAHVAAYMGHVQANAEACVRRAIGRLADGAARVPMDGGGEIAVEITVDRRRRAARLDFTASSAQLDSNFNAPSAIVDAAALYVFRTLVDDDIPLNAGCLAPLEIIVADGSMLAPRPPAAVVAGNVETSQHIVDALYLALGVMANAQGTMNNFTFGDDARQYYETICGGAGATADAAGADAVHSHMTNSRLTDPEILERRFPVRLERFAVRPGSGGAGRHRGGDGASRRLRFLSPMQVALLSTRRVHAPAGARGGEAGLPGAQRLIAAGGAVRELPACFGLMVEPEDVIEIDTPGGGGYGPA